MSLVSIRVGNWTTSLMALPSKYTFCFLVLILMTSLNPSVTVFWFFSICSSFLVQHQARVAEKTDITWERNVKFAEEYTSKPFTRKIWLWLYSLCRKPQSWHWWRQFKEKVLGKPVRYCSLSHFPLEFFDQKFK